MDQVRTILGTLSQQAGVNLVMIVSRDGFVVEADSERKSELDTDSVGAAISAYWNMADTMGKELETDLGLTSVLEFRQGLLSTAFIEQEDLLLAVLADRETNPASVRYLTAKFSELLGKVL